MYYSGRGAEKVLNETYDILSPYNGALSSMCPSFPFSQSLPTIYSDGAVCGQGGMW